MALVPIRNRSELARLHDEMDSRIGVLFGRLGLACAGSLPLTVDLAAILIRVPRADEMPRLAMKVIVSGPVVSVVDRLCDGRYRYPISQPAFLNWYCYVNQG